MVLLIFYHTENKPLQPLSIIKLCSFSPLNVSAGTQYVDVAKINYTANNLKQVYRVARHFSKQNFQSGLRHRNRKLLG
jgi:hypothetical protein